MAPTTERLAAFDGAALIRALDERRRERDLTWVQLADALHDQSAVLNARLDGDGMCSGALVRTARRETMSCQYALPLLRWLDRAPEDFLDGPGVDVGDVRLPVAGPESRLRWDLPALYVDLAARRVEEGMTWAALGAELDCTPARLTNLRTARLADLGLVMRITQWIGAPSSRYIHATDW